MSDDSIIGPGFGGDESDRPADESLSATELGRIAKYVRHLKMKSRPTRPLIIEFSGSPKSGKSTAINSLATFLKRNGYRVRVIKEYATDSPITDKKNWLFNLWTATSTIRSIAQYLSSRSPDVDIILLDRGLFDALCWLKWLGETGRIESETRDAISSFLRLERFRSSLDLIFVFTTSPRSSIDREYSLLLTDHYGTIMNPTILDEYLRAARATIREHRDEFKMVVEVDTSDTMPMDVGRQVTLTVLNALRDSLKERVAYFGSERLKRVFADRLTAPLAEVEQSRQSVKFEVRPIVESEVRWVQPVVVAVVTNADRSRVAVWRKRQRSLGDRSPEAERSLLYLGGHVRTDDAFKRPPGALHSIFRNALERELTEEVGQTLRVLPDDPFCIWDRVGPKRSRQHMAVVFVAEVDFEVFDPKLDHWEYGGDDLGDNYTVSLVDDIDSSRLETWSALILKRVFGKGSQDVLPIPFT